MPLARIHIVFKLSTVQPAEASTQVPALSPNDVKLHIIIYTTVVSR